MVLSNIKQNFNKILTFNTQTKMSNNTEKYNYDFDFSKEESNSVSGSIGKPEKFILDLNTKTEELLRSFLKKVNETNPTKNFMEEFSKVNRGEHTGTFRENIEKYLNSVGPEVDNFHSMSELIKIISEKFSPEELAVICAHQYKKILLEMSTRIIVKDILFIATEVNMEDEQRKRFINFMNTFMKLNKEDASNLFSNKGFIYFILSSIL